jgi:hypothetical protein
MMNSKSISQKRPDLPDLDFALIREEGIQHIQELAGETWTDHNTHDPGITLLDLLAYGLTDLGYRMDLPINDLLSARNEKDASLYPQFLTPARALACEPINENDYRKLIIDCDEDIINAWLVKNENKVFYILCKTGEVRKSIPKNPKDLFKKFIINGLYDILLQINPLVKNREQELTEKVRNVFRAHRNLCEDVMEVHVIPQEEFLICADIQLGPGADLETVHAQILFDVQRFLTPTVSRFTLQELLDKGKTTDEIFEGHIPEFGFFDEEELAKSAFPQTGRIIRTSDLIRIIMQVPGVVAIPKIHMKLADSVNEEGVTWSLPIDKGQIPVLGDWVNIHDPKAIGSKWSPIRFYKDLFPYYSNTDELIIKMQELWNSELLKIKNRENAVKDIPIPWGRWQNTGYFSTIQKELPALYGIGPKGLPVTGDSAVDKIRRAKALQLQAYLMFYEQILASQAGLIEKLPVLLSPSPAGKPELRLRKTFDVCLPEGVTGIEKLFLYLNGAHENEIQEKWDQLLVKLNNLSFKKSFTNEIANQRKRNQLLDHLLARYAENFDDYVLIMHRVFGGLRQEWEIIDDKDDFLNEYELLSKCRARAYNYSGLDFDETGKPVDLKVWYGPDDIKIQPARINVAGVVRRVARLTGIDNYRTRNLAKINYEVYQEKDKDNISEFRFRIVDEDGKKILLSSSAKYTTEEKAILEMRAAIQRALFEDGYELKITINNKYYFNVVDTKGQVLARRIEYFDSEEHRAEAIKYLVDFLTERYSEEGFFVLEHSLLLPEKNNDHFLPVCTDENCQVCESIDPYSFRVSVILPGYAPRFTNMAFRAYFERTLRSELPAHILAKICWIGKNQMAEFETKYNAWIQYKQQTANGKKPDNASQALNDLLDIAGKLYTIYPPGTLHDCKEDVEDRPIVLGKSHLGSQNEEDLNPDDGTRIFT